MPKLVKIGRTSSRDAQTRLSQLYTTGVPVPFRLEFACRVSNAYEVESALHLAFSPNRINPKREFFQIEPEQAIAILKLLHVEDATKEINDQPPDDNLDQMSLAAAEQMRKRRPNLNFEEMGIPIGAVLQSTDNDSTVTVVGPKKVQLGDDILSLTAATNQLLQLDYQVVPGPHWTYQGKTITEIYEETYTDIE
jgi:hypothetical protein